MTTKPTTKQTATATAGKRNRELEIQRQQQAAQQRLLLIVGIVALVAVIGIIVIPNVIPVEAQVSTEITDKYSKFTTQGFATRTTDGYFALGAENAPVQMEEFSSFSCPHCKEFYDGIATNVLDKIEAGQLRLIYVPLTQYGAYDSTNSTKAALCAGEQGKFWEFHAMLFDWQGRYGTSANDARRLGQGAANMGLDMNKYNACYNGSEADGVLQRAKDLAVERGVSGTPTVFLDGVKQSINLSTLRGYVEAKLAAPVAGVTPTVTAQ